MPKIRGGSVGNISQLRKALKKKNNTAIMQRVPSEGSIEVRFMTEPDGWKKFWEHYDETRNYFPCVEPDCIGCAVGNRSSERYLASVVLIDESRVVPLVMPKTLAAQVMKAYDKYHTILDRDYDLSRTGTGFDTEYSALPEDATKRNLSRYEELDLMEILEAQLGSKVDDEDDEYEEELVVRKKPKRVLVVDEDEEDEYESDEEDDDEEEEEAPRPRAVRPTRPVKKPVKRTFKRSV